MIDDLLEFRVSFLLRPRAICCDRSVERAEPDNRWMADFLIRLTAAAKRRLFDRQRKPFRWRVRRDWRCAVRPSAPEIRRSGPAGLLGP